MSVIDRRPGLSTEFGTAVAAGAVAILFFSLFFSCS